MMELSTKASSKMERRMVRASTGGLTAAHMMELGKKTVLMATEPIIGQMEESM